MLYTIFGMVVFSLAAAKIKPPLIFISDLMLAGIYCGVICGTRSGIILRSI